jgi:hypothetical protein
MIGAPEGIRTPDPQIVVSCSIPNGVAAPVSASSAKWQVSDQNIDRAILVAEHYINDDGSVAWLGAFKFNYPKTLGAC